MRPYRGGHVGLTLSWCWKAFERFRPESRGLVRRWRSGVRRRCIAVVAGWRCGDELRRARNVPAMMGDGAILARAVVDGWRDASESRKS